MKNVCFLFGINGVGKSTIAGHSVSMVRGSVRISSSEVLRHAFDGASREEIERISVIAKREVLRSALLRAFALHAQAPLIVCEMHLVVCIRQNGITRRECMWDEAFRPYGRAYFMLNASTDAVLRRRHHDVRMTGRIRSLEPDGIEQDARANHSEFKRLFRQKDRAFVFDNCGDAIQAARSIVGRSLQANACRFLDRVTA